MAICKKLTLFSAMLTLCSLVGIVGSVVADTPPAQDKTDWKSLFEVPDFQQVPPAVEVLSKKTADGVTTTEFYMAGPQFNGKPTRIYAFYSRPEKAGKYPGVLELHGAGYGKLAPNAAIGYAKNGFCCIAIEWFGKPPGRKESRQPDYSQYNSPGKIAAELPGEAKKPWPHVYGTFGPDADGIRAGVMFARRATMFLKSRPEVDSDKLFISGMSAGAHLTLLIIGVEPSFKAAAVKYGCAFIRDLDGYFGGYFGPLTLCPRAEQDAWLAAFDPKHGIPDYKAKVLLLSGTDDIFFWMPVVLKTYRAIPTDKRLVMLPNDNHSQVGNWQTPLRWFKAVLGTAPAWPTVAAPAAKAEGGKLLLSVGASGAAGIAKASFWIKRMPLATFRHGADSPKPSVKWIETPAAKGSDGTWTAAIALPAAGEQIVAYAMIEDETGVKVSSDTVEVPAFPKWRGVAGAAR